MKNTPRPWLFLFIQIVIFVVYFFAGTSGRISQFDWNGLYVVSAVMFVFSIVSIIKSIGWIKQKTFGSIVLIIFSLLSIIYGLGSIGNFIRQNSNHDSLPEGLSCPPGTIKNSANSGCIVI